MERWLSGRKRHTANVLCGVITASGVRIPPSPNDMKSFLKKLLPEWLILLLWHKPRGVLAAWIAGFPGKKITCIAVAGTKGKTSTSFFLYQLLQKSGTKAALFSTASLALQEKVFLNPWKMTTPSPFVLQLFLLKARGLGCTHAVIEVSSHALKQHRVWGILFSAVAITNLTPDHLDYHTSPEEYIDIHKHLISPSTKTIVLNADDPYSKGYASLPRIVSFSSHDTLGTDTNNTKPWWMPLQKINLIAAYKTAQAIGIDEESLNNALQSISPPPGRFEEIHEGQPFRVIVDYAHSPESLSYFFNNLRPLIEGRLIVVFGACGDRDATTRPTMGSLLERFADVIILTTDDPYSEDPNDIARQVSAGISPGTCTTIIDRKEAIGHALSLAQPGDCVCVLGKGAEQFQIFRDKKIAWDDREVVRDILRAYQKTITHHEQA